MSRLSSLDVFRGITIVVMIIVNSPGNSSPYAWFQHSVWNGCTIADLVFPFFVVILGISSVLALSGLQAKGVSNQRLFKKVMQRTAYIFLMGLLLNAFPYHFDPHSIRILGVLQRIALCYFVSAIFCLTTGIRTQAIVMVGLLLGYAVLITCIYPMGAGTDPLSLEGNLVGFIDRWVFAPGHLYSPMFDPEGLLSTIPAIASVLLGNLVGYFLISSRTMKQKWYGLLQAGILLSLIGFVWSAWLPLNKAIWSSSYVLWTGGLALLTYAILFALIEMAQWQRWSAPFDLFGRHAMLVYLLHVLFLKVQAMFHIQTSAGVVGLRPYLTDRLFGFTTLEMASFLYSLCYVLIWYSVLLVLQWRQQNALRA